MPVTAQASRLHRRVAPQAPVRPPTARSPSANEAHLSPRGGKGLLPSLFGDVADEFPLGTLSTALTEKPALFLSRRPCTTWRGAWSVLSSFAWEGRGRKSQPKRLHWQFRSRGACLRLVSRCTPTSRKTTWLFFTAIQAKIESSMMALSRQPVSSYCCASGRGWLRRSTNPFTSASR